MSYNVLKSKREIIFEALNSVSTACITALKVMVKGMAFTGIQVLIARQA